MNTKNTQQWIYIPDEVVEDLGKITPEERNKLLLEIRDKQIAEREFQKSQSNQSATN